MERAERVVLDPVWLLHGLLGSDARAQRVRRAWQTGLIRPLVSAESVKRLMRAMAYPALGLTLDDQQELLADFLPYAAVVKLDPARRGTRVASLPASLSMAVDLALQGDADRLLTDDERLRAWIARSRHPWARQLCAISDFSAWMQALSPSQRAQLLC